LLARFDSIQNTIDEVQDLLDHQGYSDIERAKQLLQELYL